MHVWNIKLIDSFVHVYIKSVHRQCCLLKRDQISKCLSKEKRLFSHIYTLFKFEDRVMLNSVSEHVENF